ncbi:MAG: GNAT family N-acetyltransferase [Chloroflexia bacterium]|nr:GNAT family N-acetyltransferase [Chloroflexia bacterium]
MDSFSFPGARVEHISGDMGLPEADVLRLLKAAFGGDDAPPWPANQRWLLWSAGELLGHVSVQRRWFIVHKRYFEGWFVGGVCVDPDFQRAGIGTLLMQRAHADLALQELGFAVLNCGRPLLRFYERLGYTKISDRALYIRGDKLALDEDPALAIRFKADFDLSALAGEAFPFGFDF